MSEGQARRNAALACINGAGVRDMGTSPEEEAWVETGDGSGIRLNRLELLQRIVGALRAAENGTLGEWGGANE